MLDLNERPLQNYSAYIGYNLKHNYTYLANVFSETKGITIEHYIIEKKIDKAIVMLHDGSHSITQITGKLYYSSIGHFSNQFKKITGVSPTTYKKKFTAR